MIKIYEISSDKLAKIKSVLEAEDSPGEDLGVDFEVGEGKKTEIVRAKSWKINEFKRQGYLLRDASALEINKKCSYLYINAGDDFFKKNEKILLDFGAKLLSGKEYNEVKEKIENAEKLASEGLGFLFG